MIEFRLYTVAQAHGIENGYQLMKALNKNGVEITPASANRVWKGVVGRGAITFQMLDNLCNLFNCGTGDLLVCVKKRKK